MAHIYSTPVLDRSDILVIGMVDELRRQLKNRVAEPRRWTGKLRRMSFARAVQASNSIEGYDASLDDVVAAVEQEAPLDANQETRLALEGYRDAMTYVLQLSQDPTVGIDTTLIKSLHYMMMKHDLGKNPGRWRPGVIYVRREPSGEVIYEGPDADAIEELVVLMLDELEADSAPVLVRAAMAHLSLVMIHPFGDGNGRMARCFQTLILARERILVPEFSSIEEYLGRNTPAYLKVLADSESEKLWVHCADLAERHKLPERCIGPMWDAAVGLRLRNATYRSSVEYGTGERISNLTATRDLKALVGKDFLIAVGQGRGRHYVAAKALTDLWESVRATRPPRDERDPYEVAETADPAQLKIPDVNRA